jgi:2-polyprenyl-6-methoxyphenol hydroxylase-like FAD-dependent oxidoreductase
MSDERIETGCCIAGGGPAGLMLGYLLARAGVEVVVLEKHADFHRDFRGDTVHPSTLEILDELGLLDEFLALPHSELRQFHGMVGRRLMRAADFRHVPGRCKFIAIMPQWDFLNFIAERARRLPGFRLEMNTEAVELLRSGTHVAGIVAKTSNGTLEISADLVVAADGRHSAMRDTSELQSTSLGEPVDILWMRISREPDDPAVLLAYVAAGCILVSINCGSYYQCGYLIRQGSYDAVRSAGLDALRQRLASLMPALAGRVAELESWDDIKLLAVRVDRLQTWHRSGLLCIGDAAHAMSPVGGVGVNLAIQDAVATANLLAMPLRRRAVSTRDLAAVQARRELPTRLTQGAVAMLQRRIFDRVLATEREFTDAHWLVRVLAAIPIFPLLLAKIFGVGFRPEHVAPMIRDGATQSPVRCRATTIAHTMLHRCDRVRCSQTAYAVSDSLDVLRAPCPAGASPHRMGVAENAPLIRVVTEAYTTPAFYAPSLGRMHGVTIPI